MPKKERGGRAGKSTDRALGMSVGGKAAGGGDGMQVSQSEPDAFSVSFSLPKIKETTLGVSSRLPN